MDDAKIDRHASNAAFAAALAHAVGDHGTYRRFIDPMLRAWMLSRPVDALVVFEARPPSGSSA